MGAFREAITSTRVVTALQVLCIAFLVVYTIGLLGYHIAFDDNLTDSAYQAALTMSGQSGKNHLHLTDGQKLWNGFYSLSANIFLVALVGGVVGVILAEYIEVVDGRCSR